MRKLLATVALVLCAAALGAQEVSDAQKAAAQAAAAYAGANQVRNEAPKPVYWTNSVQTNINFIQSSKYYDLAQKYLPNGCSGVLAFGLKDGRDGAHAAMAKFQRIYIATHVADAQSSVLNPANTTHRQLTDAELLEAGVTPDMIRLSVGLEDTEDLIQDLETALAQ